MGLKKDRVKRKVREFVTAYWSHHASPVPMVYFTRRWCALGRKLWGEYWDFLADLENSAGIRVVWCVTGNRVVFTRVVWDSLSDAERYRWEWALPSKPASSPVSGADLEEFSERHSAHRSGGGTVVPFFRRVPSS